MRKALNSLVGAASLLLLSQTASAQSTVWNDGSPSRLQHTCVLGLDPGITEDLIWTWTGFQGLPLVGQTYYARIMVGGLGCSGAWVHPEVKLPRGTTFAIDASHPVQCFYQDTSTGAVSQLTDGSCPTAPDIGLYPTGSSWPNPSGSGISNDFWAFGPATQPMWPVPEGKILIIAFPLTSNQPLSGIATNDYLLGAVNVVDNNPGGSAPWDGHEANYQGNTIPTQGAWQGVFVTSSAYTGPRITYPEPAAELITQVTARTHAYVYNSACLNPSQIVFTCDNVDTVPNPTTLAFAGGACTALADGGSDCYADWTGMYADKLYKFNAAFDPASITNCGTVVQDQGEKYFRTAPVPGTQLYSLLALSDGKGKVALTPPDGAYASGTHVSAQATADAGNKFAGWTLDGADAGTANPLDVPIASANRTLIAHFDPSSGGGKGGCSCDLLAGSADVTGGSLLAGAASLLALLRRRRKVV